jgi:hypothetical protein
MEMDEHIALSFVGNNRSEHYELQLMKLGGDKRGGFGSSQ